MTQENLIQTLKDLGLSDKESLIYLTSLELGPAPILKISKFSGLKRPTVYLLVENLIKKGLMRIEITHLKKLYAAENPNRLESIFNQRKDELLKNLPFFQQLYTKDTDDSLIKYYEGLEAIKLLYLDMIADIRPGEDYLVISNIDIWYSLDPKFFQKFIEKRAKLDIKLRLLLQDTPIAHEHKKFERNFNEKIKLLPVGTNLSTNMVTTPRKVLLHLLNSNPMKAIVIENKTVSGMNKELFELIWNSIKE